MKAPPPIDLPEPEGTNVHIDYRKCTNCAICIRSCPVDVLRINPHTRWLEATFWQDCMLCKLCEVDCPEDAIHITPDKILRHSLSWG